MRRRKNKDKRVLVSPMDNRPPAHMRNKGRNNRRNNPIGNRGGYKKSKKTNGLTLLIVVIALVAFIAGAGFGISLSLDDGSDDGPHFENVTKEMTTNLNDTDYVYFDSELDDVDFNDNATLEEYNVTEEPSY